MTRSLAFLLLLLLSLPLAARDATLHLPLGDPARKDRQAPLVLDAVTDTRTGALITPAELAARLGDVRLLLVGESHTDMDFHRVQLRVLEELVRSGRKVLLGLEMYPYTEQRFLDDWVDGKLGEEQFLETSRWYDAWGYNWNYYRDLFLFARDRKIRMFAANAPRAVVEKVRKKGFESLTPEEAAHIPREIDTRSAEHRTLFKAHFDSDDPLHSGMTEEQWDGMIAAQATWDATMAHNAVRALEREPGAMMVVLVGAGHVAYGLGIERQAARGFKGRIASVIPVNVEDSEGDRVDTVQASYADFLWGLPPATDPLYPSLGLSTSPASDEKALKVIFVSEKTPAATAGFEVGDVLLALDGTPVPDKETLNRLMSAKRWGDTAVLRVRRGSGTVEIPVLLRRQASR
ncbi:MAG TPA: ChaN family lipoprotein [Thermoanaerobaculia bacterium]|nr:ChaN family lipoprotein [Thermoanaerobaculia bacterium]